MRELRLLPIVLLAAGSLLALKTLWFVAGPAEGPPTMVAQPAPAATTQVPDVETTGAAGGKPERTGTIQHPAALAQPPPPGPSSVIPTEPDVGQLSAGEKALLQRLQERRQELEARARELDMRENLIKAAEKRLEQRVDELKALEAQVNAAMGKREESETQQLKGLVVMYESMRAKDAARIFDRLDVNLLVQVVGQMNPRKMADILAQMQPETAERLTVELASRRSGQAAPRAAPAAPPPPSELPKIEGRKS